MDTIGNFVIVHATLSVLTAHAVFCGIGFLLRPPRRRPYITGVFAVLVTTLLMLINLDRGHSGLGTISEWYMIFSVVSAGIVPLVTLFCAFWAGRFLSTFRQNLP